MNTEQADWLEVKTALQVSPIMNAPRATLRGARRYLPSIGDQQDLVLYTLALDSETLKVECCGCGWVVGKPSIHECRIQWLGLSCHRLEMMEPELGRISGLADRSATVPVLLWQLKANAALRYVYSFAMDI